MKKILFFIICIIVAVFFFTNHEDKLDTNLKQKTKKAKKIVLAKSILKKQIRIEAKHNNSKITKQCQIHFNEISSMDLDQYFDSLISQNIIFSKKCKLPPTDHFKILSEFSANINICLQNKTRDKCKSLLLLYRAQVIDQIHGKTPLQDSDSTVLMNRLISSFLQEMDAKSLEKNILISDELISRIPNLYSAHKAKAVSMLMAKMLKIKEYEEAEESIDNCLELNESDPELFQIFVMSKKGSADYHDFLQDSIIEHPNNGVLNYMLSNHHFGNNNLVQAKIELERALKKDPKNSKFLKTRAKLANFSQDDDRSIYSASFNIDLQNF